MTRNLHGCRVLITGASAGFGRALARGFDARGAKLVLMARNEARLQEIAEEMKCEVALAAGDVCEPAARARALQSAETSFGGLDVLINNAGVGAVSLFTETQPETIQRMMEVNFAAPLAFIREATPLLREGRSPLVVNVTSILAQFAIPQYLPYCASKAALHAASETLRYELKPLGIDLLEIAPGRIATEFQDNLVEGSPMWSKTAGSPPEQIAAAAVHAIARGRTGRYTPDWRGWWILLAAKLAPWALRWYLARRAAPADQG